MVTGDSSYIKKFNRNIILQRIVEHGSISRADLSKITGLNKATISVQVADLLDSELIYETQQEHTSVGRRPILLSLNQKAGYVLGVDLDYKKIQYTISDLLGNPIMNEDIKFDTDDYHAILQLLIKQINLYKEKCPDSHYGLVGVVIGIHGTVNKDDQSVLFVPKYQWHNKDLKNDLLKEIDLPILIENNANLSTYAERVFYHHDCNNLLTLIISSGMGAGIMIDGELQRGYHGYAGEMGHMIVVPDGESCTCGNKGCWELYSTEPSLFKKIAIHQGQDLSYQKIKQLIKEQDKNTLADIEQFIKYLSIGINNIINIFNPETLVLTSEVLTMYPNAIEKIEMNLHSSVSQYNKIVLSKFHNRSCVMGACALAIQTFLEIPKLTLNPPEEK
ncbi:ROK family transcriptional regulator [Amphibacillus sp. MSJ-3]|uniref:ROK family transcriptional regulator n=1 Tax=Amphibacillus sp. MSJ-3 TaxID=2841505 RepID=UPI001C0E9935|nr:ROK family transcriptional regulator [Amphibacillus sp. MSJ-3]MBU5594054.1 ROK family transcriptional regulator [Amphibacillus sp. MSJ-3]